MSPLLVTIVGGVVVVIVGLLIEYGVIKKKKRIETGSTLDAPQSKQNLVHSANHTDVVELPWPDAINKALDSFQTLHGCQEIRVHSTNVDTHSARLFVVVPGSCITLNKHFGIIVNKSGEILKIEQSR